MTGDMSFTGDQYIGSILKIARLTNQSSMHGEVLTASQAAPHYEAGTPQQPPWPMALLALCSQDLSNVIDFVIGSRLGEIDLHPSCNYLWQEQ
jgi:hypothetical protein